MEQRELTIRWWCWRCKFEHHTLVTATAVQCPRGHTMKQIEEPKVVTVPVREGVL